MDHLRIALSLLGKRQVPSPDTIGHVDLLALLASGIPVDLPDGKQLTMGVLRSESPWVGQSVHSDCLVEARDDIEIMAILRQGQMLLPHPDTVLRAEDQLLVITSSQARARLAEHLTLLSP